MIAFLLRRIASALLVVLLGEVATHVGAHTEFHAELHANKGLRWAALRMLSPRARGS